MTNKMVDFATLCQGCRTYRRFLQNPIDEALFQEMAETVRLTPSAMNAQILRYVFVRTPENVEALQDCVHWAAFLPKEEGTPQEGEQPVAFILICHEGRHAYVDMDIGIAARTLSLHAYSYGIGSCILGSIEKEKAKERLSLPPSYEVSLALALGYPAHTSHIVIPTNGKLTYFLDEDKNYCVPKRSVEDLCLWK